MRIIRNWEDRMLLEELAEVRQLRTEQQFNGAQNLGLVNYEMGLRTAGIMLGALDGWASRAARKQRWRWWRR